MRYNITKEDLGNDWLYVTLIALSRCMSRHGLPLYVVGATARDIAMKLLNGDEPKRRTRDLDVAIAIEDWECFDNICETLESSHFKRCGETQKFFYMGENGDIDFEVDVVPFGGVAVDEMICWPPEGNPVMSVKCFQDVMNGAVTVGIDGKMEVRIAPLCGQFLIKLDAWNDRNALTDKDAEDMLFILKSYFDTRIQKENCTPPDVVSLEDESMDTIVWGAQWLAHDICQLLTTAHLRFYADLIQCELDKEERSLLVYHSMKYYGGGAMDDISGFYEPCRHIWKKLVEVFNHELEERNKR